MLSTAVRWLALALAACVAVLSAPKAARADNAVVGGVGLAYARPLKGAFDSPSFAQSHAVQLRIDLGFAPVPELTFGAFGAAHWGATGERVCSEQACARLVAGGRLGLMMQIHAARGTAVDPWVELGVGLQMDAIHWDSRLLPASDRVGFGTAAALGAGLDFAFARPIGLGPFIGIECGRYWQDREANVWGFAGVQIRIL